MDPGGIGKGYAVDRMVDVLRQKGFTTALVAGSGSSIYGMGAPPSEPRGWRVEDQESVGLQQNVGGGFPERHVDVDLGKLRKVFPRGG